MSAVAHSRRIWHAQMAAFFLFFFYYYCHCASAQFHINYWLRVHTSRDRGSFDPPSKGLGMEKAAIFSRGAIRGRQWGSSRADRQLAQRPAASHPPPSQAAAHSESWIEDPLLAAL